MKKRKFKSRKISKSSSENSERKSKSIYSNNSDLSNRSINSYYKYQSQIGSRSSKSERTTQGTRKQIRPKTPKFTSKLISTNDSESLPKNLASKIKHIESLPPAIMVRNESGMNSAGFFIEPVKLTSTDYSLILKASKKVLVKSESNNQEKFSIVTKITNLTECSPRFRTNLLKNSVRIMRFIGTLKRIPSTAVFMKIYEIFQVDSVKLYIFMEECQYSITMYDLVKSPNPMKPEEIRLYFKAIANGINVLQKVGVAHRYLKLQHILFDLYNQPKLCGWSRAVFSYDTKQKKCILQNVERRVRRNYYLPPEAFMAPYNPSKTDIWSLGVILVAMSTKRYPFNVRDEKNKFSNQWREFIKKHELNVNVRNLCNKIFIIDPRKRITSDNLLSDVYFKISPDKLQPLSIRADTEIIDREESRVGALSAIDFEQAQMADGLTEADVKYEEGYSGEALDIYDGNTIGEKENGQTKESQQIDSESTSLADDLLNSKQYLGQ